MTTRSRSTRQVPLAATAGLFGAWALHDAEELATMAGWAERARPRLEARLPRVPRGVWRRLSVSQRHVNVSIGLMGCVIAAAAADGARTDGASPLFQAVLTGFGLHAIPHAAAVAVTRGYTPGAVTAPIVVVPFSVWARRRLARAGVPIAARTPAAALLGPLVVAGTHAAASALLRARARPTHPEEQA